MKKNFDDATGRSKFFDDVNKELSLLLDPATGKIKSELVEWVKCPVCEADEFEFLFTKQGFDFVRCRKCTLTYVNPRLFESAILEYYGDSSVLQSMTDWVEVLTNSVNQSWQVPYFQDIVHILSKHISSGGSILDVGCSIGLFMELAQKSGFVCVGLEPEPVSREYALGKGLDVRPFLLSDAGFSEEEFDGVTLFGVVEHLSNPRQVLADVWKVLKPGGVVMAEVPNVYGLINAILHDTARTFTGRNHLSYFSWDTLSELFTRCGYKVIYVDTALAGLDAVLNHLQFNNPHSDFSLNLLPPKLRNFLQTSDGRAEFEKLVCDWDMGLRLRIVAQKPK